MWWDNFEEYRWVQCLCLRKYGLCTAQSALSQGHGDAEIQPISNRQTSMLHLSGVSSFRDLDSQGGPSSWVRVGALPVHSPKDSTFSLRSYLFFNSFSQRGTSHFLELLVLTPCPCHHETRSLQQRMLSPNLHKGAAEMSLWYQKELLMQGSQITLLVPDQVINELSWATDTFQRCPPLPLPLLLLPQDPIPTELVLPCSWGPKMSIFSSIGWPPYLCVSPYIL